MEFAVFATVISPDGYEVPLRVELLNAGALLVDHVDVPRGVGGYLYGVQEIAVLFAEDPPAGYEFSAGVELLDALVISVGDVDVPRSVASYAQGLPELAVSPTVASPL